MYGPEQIISVKVGENFVHVTKRAHPNFSYTVIGPHSQPPDRVWMESWEIQNGELVRMPDIEGRHQPSQTIPEAITFPTP